ncbi:MAG TPA: hypothetical protein VNK05_05430 [Chloroflexota bacterium]|nr:hypothetical protein [Chloroflexota bacterium]
MRILQLVVERLHERGFGIRQVHPELVHPGAERSVELVDLEVAGDLERLANEIGVALELLEVAREELVVQELRVVVDVRPRAGGG